MTTEFMLPRPWLVEVLLERGVEGALGELADAAVVPGTSSSSATIFMREDERDGAFADGFGGEAEGLADVVGF